LRYVAKRSAAGAVLVVAISTIAFFLLVTGAGDVGRKKLGVNATQEQVTAYNRKLGLNDPILTQYWRWARHAITGDLGHSWFGAETVSKTLSQRLPVTLSIVGGSLAVAAVLAVVLGIAAAMIGGRVDRSVQTVGLLGFSIPGFLIAEILVTLFAVKWNLFQATGYTNWSDSATGWLRSVTLPIISLAFASLASLALQIRGAVRDTLDLDFVRTLRSRGLSTNRVVYKHVLRNAGGPALSIVGVQFIGLLGGAVIVEQVFAIQGLGQVAVVSATKGDVPLVMGLVLLSAVLVVVVNLAVDLVTAWLNPKVRLS
jgi:peptide/nickel transport system permease protein